MSGISRIGTALPLPGLPVTIVAVDSGEVYSLDATTRANLPHGAISLVVNPLDRAIALSGLKPGARATLHYFHSGASWRLRGRISNVENAQVVLQPDGEPSQAEQRDFVRAEIELGVYSAALSERDLAGAAAAVRNRNVALSDDGWRVERMDLSAGGARLVLPFSARPGDWIDLRLAVAGRSQPLAVAAEVLRTAPAEEPGHTMAALRFALPSEQEQDELFDLVAQAVEALVLRTLQASAV